MNHLEGEALSIGDDHLEAAVDAIAPEVYANPKVSDESDAAELLSGENEGAVPENTFEALNLLPEIQRAVEAMGFTEPTDIQRQAIPLLRSGADIIGRSQTGTGKTMAFAIPAVEMIDRTEAEPTVQVLILCPTRELAQQGCDEIKKLIRFMLNVWPVDVYGGAAMDRQLYRLKRANLVIGTPGRINAENSDIVGFQSNWVLIFCFEIFQTFRGFIIG